MVPGCGGEFSCMFVTAVYPLDPQWNVAAGEDSKEKEVQSSRVKREEEAYYPDASSIPTDPKDPWEEEPSYDDSLTFEIYLDNSQRKPAPGMQIQSDHMSASGNNVIPSGVSAHNFLTEAPNSTYSDYTTPDPSGYLPRKTPSVSGLDFLLQQLSASGGVAHDPALLSLLLQNPDLVSQLTSGQGYAQSGISNQNALAPPLEPLKQPGNFGSFGAGLRNQTGDTGVDMFGASNIPVSVVHPPQPARAAPSVTQVVGITWIIVFQCCCSSVSMIIFCLSDACSPVNRSVTLYRPLNWIFLPQIVFARNLCFS